MIVFYKKRCFPRLNSRIRRNSNIESELIKQIKDLNKLSHDSQHDLRRNILTNK